MEKVQKFFEEYARVSLQGKSSELTTYYADNFMAATKKEATAFSNDKKFIAWLDSVAEFNHTSGMTAMKVKEVKTAAVGSTFLHATVTWAVTFAQKPDKDITFDMHYVLRKEEEQFKIMLYISEEDQEELMKEHGLM